MPNFDDVDLAIFIIGIIGLFTIISIAIWPGSLKEILAGVGAITGPIAGLARGKNKESSNEVKTD